MGGGHHGHHHHGGGGYAALPYNFNWGQAPWFEPATELVVIDSSDSDTKARARAYIMSLPKAKRAKAYRKIFGSDAPPGALGDNVLGLGTLSNTELALAAGAAYLLYRRMKKKRGRR